MKKYYTVVLAIFVAMSSLEILSAQTTNNVGIGTTTPDATAVLDVFANN